MKIPDLPIGQKFKLKSKPDVILQVVESNTGPDCIGCYFEETPHGYCDKIQCEESERRDNKFIKFKTNKLRR